MDFRVGSDFRPAEIFAGVFAGVFACAFACLLRVAEESMW
jgi:hypothetical protein